MLSLFNNFRIISTKALQSYPLSWVQVVSKLVISQKPKIENQRSEIRYPDRGRCQLVISQSNLLLCRQNPAIIRKCKCVNLVTRTNTMRQPTSFQADYQTSRPAITTLIIKTCRAWYPQLKPRKYQLSYPRKPLLFFELNKLKTNQMNTQ